MAAKRRRGAELRKKRMLTRTTANLVLENMTKEFQDEGREKRREWMEKIASKMEIEFDVRRIQRAQVESATKRLKRQEQEEEEKRARKKLKWEVFAQESSILTAQLENLNYTPKTKITRNASRMLSEVHKILGDVPEDILRSAADEVISTLKDVDMKASDKQKSSLLMRNKLFDVAGSKLVAIGKRLTDFKAAEDKMDVNEEQRRKPSTMRWVSLSCLMIRMTRMRMIRACTRFVTRCRRMRTSAETKSGNALKGGDVAGESDDEDDENDLNPNDIDAHWLQRELNNYYKDANLSQKLSEEVRTVLHVTRTRATTTRRRKMIVR